MGKIISIKYASKDDPIFTGRYTISNPKANLSKPKKLVKKTQETASFIKGGKNNEWIWWNDMCWVFSDNHESF